MRVNILLSTFNGELYLEELLRSLDKQTYRDIKVIIRDDGSTDNTCHILNEYVKSNQNVEVIFGENIGVIRSFYSLLKENDFYGELYAFCDQDDIWLPNKIEQAVSVLKKNNQEKTLYCSGLEYVTNDLAYIKRTRMPSLVGFENAIIENVAIGCTLVFDYSLRERFLEASPSSMLMHDWWMYMLASTYGHIVFDDYCGILYRQHDASVTPIENNQKNLINKVKDIMYVLKHRVFIGRLDWLGQAEVFVNTYPLFLENERLVKSLRNLIEEKPLLARIKFFLKPTVRSNYKYKDCVFRLKILSGLGFRG